MGERSTPKSVFELMRSYFDTARAALERHGGAVEKFIGDAVVGDVRRSRGERGRRAARLPRRARDPGADCEARAARGADRREHGRGRRRRRRAARDVRLRRRRRARRLGQRRRPARAGRCAGRCADRRGDLPARLACRSSRAGPAGRGEGQVGAADRLPAARRERTRSAAAARSGAPRRPRGGARTARAELGLAAGEQRCRLVTVVGEPGVGKSRLAAELFARVEREHVVRGACLSYGEGITYWALGQIVARAHRDPRRAFARRRRGPSSTASSQGRRTPRRSATSSPSSSARATGPPPPRSLPGRSGASWRRRRPSGRSSCSSTTSTGPSRRCSTCSQGYPPRRRADPRALHWRGPELLDARPDWQVTVRLEPLGAAEVESLLEALEAPAATRVRIARASAGNPLFAEELVAWAGEGGDLDAIPTSLNALLGARLDRLDAQARDALERGAVEGRALPRGHGRRALRRRVARRRCPASSASWPARTSIRMAAAGLVAGGVAYRFKHILVREAAYRATSKKLRASLHERFAGWLEGIAGERIGEYEAILGYHLEQAYRYRSELGLLDDDTRASASARPAFSRAAGRRALERSDHHAAVNLLERALAIGLDRPARAGSRASSSSSRASPAVGRSSDRQPLVAEALATATRIGDRALAARVRVGGATSRCGRRTPTSPPMSACSRRRSRRWRSSATRSGSSRRFASSASCSTIQGRPAEASPRTSAPSPWRRPAASRRSSGEVSYSLAYDAMAGGRRPSTRDPPLRGAPAREPGRPRVRGADLRCMAQFVAMAGNARRRSTWSSTQSASSPSSNPALVCPYVGGLDVRPGR